MEASLALFLLLGTSRRKRNITGTIGWERCTWKPHNITLKCQFPFLLFNNCLGAILSSIGRTLFLRGHSHIPDLPLTMLRIDFIFADLGKWPTLVSFFVYQHTCWHWIRWMTFHTCTVEPSYWLNPDSTALHKDTLSRRVLSQANEALDQ